MIADVGSLTNVLRSYQLALCLEVFVVYGGTYG